MFFFHFAQDIVMLFVILVSFWLSMPILALPFLAWSLVFLAFCGTVTLWKYKYDVIASECDSEVGAALSDTLSNHFTVKTFSQERTEEKRFAEATQKHYKAMLHSWMLSNLSSLGQWIIMGTGELLFIWWMITGWEAGIVTVGDFVFAQTFIAWAIGHLMSFGNDLRHLFSAIANAEEMAQVFSLTPEVRDAPNAPNLTIEKGGIEFHAVSFGYDSSAKQPALNNFNLRVKPGQSIGLVGKSGAGKSTLLKLLLRLYDPCSGYIRIDGTDIANITQASLRQQIAVVSQHPQLFHRSIRENIALGYPSASDEEITLAAKQAYAWDFISKLPEGLDTLVGERGIKLSGGEQQRIAIARAILLDPRILILDEATSALDGATEALIQRAISNLLHGRTAIVIAHRLSTIKNLDKVVVMNEGEIAETGTHSELLTRNGIYAKLWSHHTGYLN